MKKALLFCACLVSAFGFSSSADTITANQPIRDGDTIVSADDTFELGFFSPGRSKNRYLGIWYRSLSPLTVVWVANREIPLLDSSGVLNLTDRGNLILLNRTLDILWSSNSTVRNPVAQLLNSGNLVLREESDENPETPLWQSFDHPTDTWLAGMKLGVDRVTGWERFLSSWRTSEDPSPGDFKLRLDPERYSELVLSKNSVVQFRTGAWNGMGFSGTSGMKANPFFKFNMVYNQKEMTYSYKILNSSIISRLVLYQNGSAYRYVLDDNRRDWLVYVSITVENCNRYALCGPFGSCNVNDYQTCSCLQGFKPKSPEAWAAWNWSAGCERKTPLKCGNGDRFLRLSGLRLPDVVNYWYNGSMNLDECRLKCLMNCSCRAYANSDVKTGGTGCLLWFSDLMDIGDTNGNAQDFYVRMAASELDDDGTMKPNSKPTGKNRMKILGSSVAVTAILLLGLSLVLSYGCKKKRPREGHGKVEQNVKNDHPSQKEDLELPVFDLGVISTATENFSLRNKLGEGGFGPVYKGLLTDGQEIAVKRLSKGSNQGMEEFKNEVRHIAKLQHRNLVKLLGCCIEGGEKMLVYEYMPNLSLDSFLFDQTKSKVLDWTKRFHIIDGIARGLLYLHQDSRLRIIHRDLKASNVLLDREMNPKISDFGLARSFGENENEAKTKRVVGTYGYMSPEYAVDGQYSTKSDIFSFGVLVLEIVSGKRNRGFRHSEHHLNLLGHAWKLYLEGKALELLDVSLATSCNASEALRLIHISLLCVQRHAEDRPSIGYVVQLLGGDSSLQPPKQPGFFNERDPFEADSSTRPEQCSSCKLTITTLHAR